MLRHARLRRTAAAGLAAAAATVALSTAAAATPLHAQSAAVSAGCTGASCNGKDPHDMGCDADATVVDTVWDGNVRLDLRWSQACRANWTRISNLVTSWPYDFRVENKRGDVQRENFGWFGPSSGWTNMVNGEGILARACDNSVCTGWH